MICESCKQPLPDESLFCSRCGVATEKINLNTTIKNAAITDPNQHQPKHHVFQDPRIGLVLDSKYQILERLGQGGMGAVYRARRLHIGDEVAVKLLSRDLLRENHAIERFRREARSAAMISHPNVVSIHDFSDASSSGSNEAYIVMELVKGESLRHLLEREGRLSPDRAVALMRDICAGVGVAHRQGLLHRDLKPDNVIVSPPVSDSDQETAKVVDFGLAKIREENISPLTQTGELMGTIYYMSPEQCRGEPLDARADVYSLGAMFYEMLSGHPPFKASNLTGLITKHLEEPPPPFDPALGIPVDLAHICFKALSKSRADRQVDANAVGKELRTARKTPVELATNLSEAPTVLIKKTRASLVKWIAVVAGVSLVVIALVALGLAIKFGGDWLRQKEGATQNTPAQAAPTVEESAARTKPTNAPISNLNGNWTGTYGPLGMTATLTIKNHKGNEFEGVLEQGGTRVAFKGTIESASLHMKQTRVLNGQDWSLGEDTGTISDDGKSMSGTGKDAMGGALGLTYQWSFSR